MYSWTPREIKKNQEGIVKAQAALKRLGTSYRLDFFYDIANIIMWPLI